MNGRERRWRTKDAAVGKDRDPLNDASAFMAAMEGDWRKPVGIAFAFALAVTGCAVGDGMGARSRNVQEAAEEFVRVQGHVIGLQKQIIDLQNELQKSKNSSSNP